MRCAVEIPVMVDGVRGLLVIRVFNAKDDPEVSIRGQAVEKVRWRDRR